MTVGLLRSSQGRSRKSRLMGDVHETLRCSKALCGLGRHLCGWAGRAGPELVHVESEKGTARLSHFLSPAPVPGVRHSPARAHSAAALRFPKRSRPAAGLLHARHPAGALYVVSHPTAPGPPTPALSRHSRNLAEMDTGIALGQAEPETERGGGAHHVLLQVWQAWGPLERVKAP